MAKPKKKYAAVCKNLPKMGLDPKRQDVVQAVKDEIMTPPSHDEQQFTAEDCEEAVVNAIAEAKALVVQALQAAKRSAAGFKHATAFTRGYVLARDLSDVVEGWSSDVNLLIEAFQQLMVDQMEDEGVEQVTLEGGRSVSTSWEPQIKVLDPDAFRRWCVANGLERQLALPWATANMLLKERLLNGEPEPDGTMAESRTKVSLRS